jgi:hypothetical protein
MSPLFFVLIGPILVFLIIWVGATVYRLYFPERPLPFEQDPVVKRERATLEGESIPVGVREIRADQRRERRQEDVTVYNYAWGGSEGLPEEWHEDLWRRRN